MNRKVGIIGLGHVGAHVAYSIAVQGIADEIVLIDANNQKAISECQDLRDSVAYFKHKVIIETGDFNALVDCDIAVNCVGDIDLLRKNQDRIDELNFNVNAVNGFADKIKASGFNGILLNISNPCDIITRQLQKRLNFPKGRIFGTGTGLDTSRLLSVLSRLTSIDHRSINAYMIGEHGASQFAPWSVVRFGGKPLDEWAKVDERFNFDREDACTQAIKGAWVTFAGKFCTEFGIATTAAMVVDHIFRDSKAIIPVSTYLEGEYEENDIFVGVPAVVGRNGVEQVVELPLNAEEKDRFHKCCNDMRKYMELADSIV